MKLVGPRTSTLLLRISVLISPIGSNSKGKKPCTLCRITTVGLKAFEGYVEALKSYLDVKQ